MIFKSFRNTLSYIERVKKLINKLSKCSLLFLMIRYMKYRIIVLIILLENNFTLKQKSFLYISPIKK